MSNTPTFYTGTITGGGTVSGLPVTLSDVMTVGLVIGHDGSFTGTEQQALGVTVAGVQFSTFVSGPVSGNANQPLSLNETIDGQTINVNANFQNNNQQIAITGNIDGTVTVGGTLAKETVPYLTVKGPTSVKEPKKLVNGVLAETEKFTVAVKGDKNAADNFSALIEDGATGDAVAGVNYQAFGPINLSMTAKSKATFSITVLFDSGLAPGATKTINLEAIGTGPLGSIPTSPASATSLTIVGIKPPKSAAADSANVRLLSNYMASTFPAFGHGHGGAPLAEEPHAAHHQTLIATPNA